MRKYSGYGFTKRSGKFIRDNFNNSSPSDIEEILKNCGYDPEIYTGFAFGFGAERMAMLKYGIDDVRTFYTTDLRETKVFDRSDI